MKLRAHNTKRVTNKKRRVGKTKRVKPVKRNKATKRAKPVRRRRTRKVGSGKLDGKLRPLIKNIRAGNAVEENCKTLIANKKYQKNKDKMQFKMDYGDIIKKCEPSSPSPASSKPETPSSSSPQASSTTQDELIEQIQQILSNYKK